MRLRAGSASARCWRRAARSPLPPERLPRLVLVQSGAKRAGSGGAGPGRARPLGLLDAMLAGRWPCRLLPAPPRPPVPIAPGAEPSPRLLASSQDPLGVPWGQPPLRLRPPLALEVGQGCSWRPEAGQGPRSLLPMIQPWPGGRAPARGGRAPGAARSQGLHSPDVQGNGSAGCPALPRLPRADASSPNPRDQSLRRPEALGTPQNHGVAAGSREGRGPAPPFAVVLRPSPRALSHITQGQHTHPDAVATGHLQPGHHRERRPEPHRALRGTAGAGSSSGQGIPKICASPASPPIPQDAGEELLLESGEDGAAGAASGEPPGYEDYYDGDPASPERFGPTKREETVIRAPQVTLGTRTGTPSRHGRTSWGHGMGSGGPAGGSELSPELAAAFPDRGAALRPAGTQPEGGQGRAGRRGTGEQGGRTAPRGHSEPCCGSPVGVGLQDGAQGRAVLAPFSFRVGDSRGRRDPRALR